MVSQQNSALVSISVFTALSTVFHAINSPTTLRFLTLFFRSFSAVLVLSTIEIVMKVSLSPEIILCG